MTTASNTPKRPAKYSREMLQEQINLFTPQFCRDSASWRDLRLTPPDTTITTPFGSAPAWKSKTVLAMFLRWEREARRRGSFLRINPETLTLETVDCSFEKRDNTRRAAWVFRVQGVEVKP
jgi:hypothetical protein